MLLFFFLAIIYLINISLNFSIDLRLLKAPLTQTFGKFESKFYIDNDYLYLIPICLGTPPQCFHVFYEVNFTHLLINPGANGDPERFHQNQSSTAINTNMNAQFYLVNSSSLNDVAYFDLYKINLDWLLGTKVYGIYSIFDGKMGFGRKYDNSTEKYHEKFSIIHYFYNAGKIKKKVFGHKYFHDRKYMRLYIGEIDLDEFNNNQKYPKCFVENATSQLIKFNEEFKHLWACELKKIVIYETSEKDDDKKNTLFELIPNINNSVLFTTVFNAISGPLEQGNKLIDYLLSLPHAKDKCRKISLFSDHLNIICNWDVDIYKFPTITFFLNGVELVLYPQNLFYKKYQISLETYSYFGRFEFTPYNHFWGFGQSILREYDMIFDMDEGTVGFWNVVHEDPIDLNYFLKVIAIISGLIVICILVYFCIVVIASWYKKHYNILEKERLLSKVEKMQEITTIKHSVPTK